MMIPRSTQPELARDLRVSHAAAVVVGTVIGSGIFLVPSEMMQAVGSARLVYLAWVVGGLLSWFGAISYAELGAMKPQAGGEYVYIRDAYGPLGGFLYGWTYFLIAKPGSIATIVTGFVRILGTFAPLAVLQQTWMAKPVPLTCGQIVAVAAIMLITLLNYIGVKRAGEFQLFFTLLKVATILGIVVIGFSYAGGSCHHFTESHAGATGGFGGFMAALIAALWAYDGWNLVTTVSAEIRNPQRSLPIALIAGVAIVAALYILMNAAVQYVMPPAAIAASPRPASEAMLIAMGSLGAAIVSAGMALSMLVTLNGSTMTGARIPFALARDGYFFEALARVHPRFHTPSAALVVQGVLAIVLVLFAGTFQQLFSLTLFAEWLFYMLGTASVFIFRYREPDTPRPYKTWGYPVVPVCFILASAVLVYFSFMANWRNSAIGLAVILAGIPVFYHFRARSNAPKG
ncbi:MAG TPA: amino acid permease [Terriglobales bacterium]|nr:amino acid permease [Terriglobales bacterium]